MIVWHNFQRTFLMLLLTGLMLFLVHSPVDAGIITTTQLIDAQQVQSDRRQLDALLARQQVREALSEQGVDVQTVQARINGMTDAEVRTMAAQMEQLPAGGRLTTLEILLLIIILLILI